MPELQLKGGELDGLALHYLVEGRGPAVVLLHGLGGFAESWRHNVTHLARQATVYALDLPGFGLSGKPRATYHLPFFVRTVHGFTEALGLGSVALVGHSLGGAVAMAYALTYRGEVERLALLAGVVPGFGYRASWLLRLIALRGVGELLGAINAAPAYRAAISRCFVEPDRAEVGFLVDCARATRTSPEARAAYLATLRDVRRDFREYSEHYRKAIAQLDVPVLAIHGRQDPVVSVAHCAALVDGCRRGAVRWIERCGHFPQIEHPAAVNACLAEFLVGRPAAR
jgi:pimeloyl-ACP methyl ester carboxylesterase